MAVTKEMYDKHALSNRELNTFLTHSNSDIMDLPICPKCETIGLRTQGFREERTMRCPKCGYWGNTTKTYGEFVAELLYED